MSNIARAWKDEAYRQSLSVEEQATLPVNPVGEIELTQEELEAISGAGCGHGDSDPSESNQADVSQMGFATADIHATSPLGTSGGLLSLITSTLTASSPTPFINVSDNTCTNTQSANPAIWDGF